MNFFFIHFIGLDRNKQLILEDLKENSFFSIDKQNSSKYN